MKGAGSLHVEVTCVWTCGHRHTERLQSDKPFPRILKVGYYPHFIFFIYDHLEGQTPFYRQAALAPSHTASAGSAQSETKHATP